ncbi:MAG: hypothetical protein J6T15_05305 [Bacilli bacterium]|nr:hypothetical protein [Bacilli bacterium]
MNNGLLFLDIDGVVNTFMIGDEPFNSRAGGIKRGSFYFDMGSPSEYRVSNKQALLWVSKLCIDYKLDIVISSSWLIGNELDKIKFSLYSSGLSKEVNIIGGVSPNLCCHRGLAIELWLEEHKIDLNKTPIVILDDDCDMAGSEIDLTPYLVKTDTYVGFSHRDYLKASELLNKEE